MHVIFIINSQSPHKNKFYELFKKTETILQSKCKPKKLLLINKIDRRINNDALFFVESEDVHSFIKRNQYSPEIFYITEDDLDFLNHILHYFDQVIRQPIHSTPLLISFKFFILFKVANVAGLADIFIQPRLSEPVWSQFVFCILDCLSFNEEIDQPTLEYITGFIAEFIYMPGFYKAFKLGFHYAIDNPSFLNRFFKYDELITCINQDDDPSNIREKCIQFLAIHRPDLCSKIHLLKIEPTTARLLLSDHDSTSTNPRLLTVSIEKIEHEILPQLSRYSTITLLKITSNSTTPEEKLEIKIEWMRALFSSCKNIEILDVRENKLHTETLDFIQQHPLKHLNIDQVVRLREKLVVHVTQKPNIQTLLARDYLYELTIDKTLFSLLFRWLKNNNHHLLNQLIDQPYFLDIFLEIDGYGDSLFHRWANHELGRTLIMKGLDDIGFYKRLIKHSGFLKALAHVYQDGERFTSALYGLCHSPDLGILQRIMYFLDPESISEEHKYKIFVASITPVNESNPSVKGQTVIHLLKKETGKGVGDIVKQFRTIFLPAYFDQKKFWEDSIDEADSLSPQAPAVSSDGRSKKISDDAATLLLDDTLLNRSKDKETCSTMLSEFEKNKGELFQALTTQATFFDIFLTQKEQQESLFYRWLKWPCMVPLIERIVGIEDMKERLIKHPGFLMALVNLSVKDNSSALHLLFQKRQRKLIDHFKDLIAGMILSDPSLWITLLVHPTRDKDNKPSCLLIEMANYDLNPNPLLMTLFNKSNQDALLPVLERSRCIVGSPYLVLHLNKLNLSYPENAFFSKFSEINRDRLLKQITQGQLRFSELLEDPKENRELLAQAFQTPSFQEAWYRYPLRAPMMSDIIEVVHDALFSRIKIKSEAFYLPDLFKTLLNHPQINPKLNQEKYKPLRESLTGLELPPVITEKTVIRPQGKVLQPSAVHPKPIIDTRQAEALPKKTTFIKKKSRSIFLPTPESAAPATHNPIFSDEQILAAKTGAARLYQWALDVFNKKIIDIDSTEVAFYETLRRLTQDETDLLYDFFEKKCFQNPILSSPRAAREAYQNAESLQCICLIRARVDIKRLSHSLGQLQKAANKTPVWLLQSMILTLSDYYKTAAEPLESAPKELLTHYLSRSQDPLFLRELLSSLIKQQDITGIAPEIIKDTQQLIDQQSPDLDQLKIHFLSLQFGVRFDLSIYAALLPIISFFNAEKSEILFKKKHSLIRTIQPLHDDGLSPNYSLIERWIREIFLIEDVFTLCKIEKTDATHFMREHLQFIGLSEAQIQDKVLAYEQQMKSISKKSVEIIPVNPDIGHELIKIKVTVEEPTAPLAVVASALPIGSFFEHCGDLAHFTTAMITSTSNYIPCIVGSQARYAALKIGGIAFFDQNHDLDFDVYECGLAEDALKDITQLKLRAEAWLFSLSSYSSPPKSLKMGYNQAMNFAWCSFKAKINAFDLDFRFVFSCAPIAEVISLSRQGRCLNWASYIWDFKNKQMFCPSIQTQLEFTKPTATLTFNEMSFILRTISCYPRLRMSDYVIHVIKVALTQYQNDLMFKEAIDSSYISQFKSKMGGAPRKHLEKVMDSLIKTLLPSPLAFFDASSGKQPTSQGLDVCDAGMRSYKK